MTQDNEVDTPRFEFERTGKIVIFTIEFTDEFAAIDFFQAMIAGAEAGAVKFAMTTLSKPHYSSEQD